MKIIHSTRTIPIPSSVKVDIHSRIVTVTGPRGKLTRSFKHLQADVTLQGKGDKSALKVDVWFGTVKQIAVIRTITSHINNMITGVTKGFEYRMKYVYAHFPVNVGISDDATTIEIRNFLGEKVVRSVKMLEGVKIARSDAKDEIILTGNDLEAVSQSAANINRSCKVHNKDIRKFLDGIYVSEKKVLPAK